LVAVSVPSIVDLITSSVVALARVDNAGAGIQLFHFSHNNNSLNNVFPKIKNIQDPLVNLTRIEALLMMNVIHFLYQKMKNVRIKSIVVMIKRPRNSTNENLYHGTPYLVYIILAYSDDNSINTIASTSISFIHSQLLITHYLHYNITNTLLTNYTNTVFLP